MRLSFPHLLLVRRGHVESTGDILPVDKFSHRALATKLNIRVLRSCFSLGMVFLCHSLKSSRLCPRKKLRRVRAARQWSTRTNTSLSGSRIRYFIGIKLERQPMVNEMIYDIITLSRLHIRQVNSSSVKTYPDGV